MRRATHDGRTAHDNRVGLDTRAVADFAARHGNPVFPSTVVVIPSYREVASIGRVVAELPTVAAGERLTTLVVVDGEDDGTVDAAQAAGAYACLAPVNRGQGAALRIGYAIAAAHGARYVVTVDADGQCDPAEIAEVLGPVLAGEADLVVGSRRRGRDDTTDRTRATGVRFYSWLATRLTGQVLTDTASPLRAMRVEVPASLTLDEDQYQASQVLVGAIMTGWRVTERPVTMRRRAAGASRKGGNLVYGLRYGAVMLRTWRRCRATTRRGPADR